MPLTSRKLAHIAALYGRAMTGRSQSITLHCKQPDGSVTTITATGIWRPMQDADPVIAGQVGTADVLAMFLETEVSLATLRSVIYAYPTTPTGAEPADRYTITALAPRGFPVGTDRIFLTLRRQ
jgi:hypothetical protein